MINRIVAPKIAREHKCKDCGHTFRPDYLEIDVKCPACGSKNVTVVWIDFLLDFIKY